MYLSLYIFLWLVAHFFLVLNNIAWSGWLIYHSPTEGHLVYFQVLAIVKEAARNILVQAFVWM